MHVERTPAHHGKAGQPRLLGGHLEGLDGLAARASAQLVLRRKAGCRCILYCACAPRLQSGTLSVQVEDP